MTPPATPLAALMRTHDWTSTAVGPFASWPQPLRVLVDLILGAAQPMFIVWGPERILIYNDGYVTMLAERHPQALGRPFADVWPDIYEDVRPVMDQAFAGEPAHMDDVVLEMRRGGQLEQVHFAFSYTPVRAEGGEVAGMFGICTEITNRVLGQQRLAMQIKLGDELRRLSDPVEVSVAAAEALGQHLNAGRVGYGEIDATGDTVLVRRDWTDGKVASLAGEARLLDTFGPAVIDELRAGGTLVVEDCLTDPRSAGDAYAATWASIGTRSLIVVPLVKDERLNAILYVHEPEPRRWTQADVTLAEDVAERTWDAIERARAEEQMRASEERFRTIYEQANDFIFTADLSQRITSCNPAFAAALGYRPDEMIGRSFAEFLDPQDYARAVSMLRQKLSKGGSTRYEVGAVARDGSRHLWEVNSRLILDSRGAPVGLHAISRDVTEARRSETLIRDSERRLRMAQEAAGLGTFAWDFTTNRVDVSDTYLKVYGFASECEVSQERLVSIVHPDDHARMRQIMDDVAAGKDADESEFRIIRPSDGEVRWIRNQARTFYDAEGSAVRRVGVVRDITERRLADEALRTSEARLRLAIEGAQIGLWDWDLTAMQGWWSPRTAEIMGVPDGENITSEQRVERIHPDDREKVRTTVETSLGNGGEFALEYRIVRPDGEVRHISSRGIVVRDAAGNAVRTTGTVLDVTEEREAEAQLRNSEERLRLALESAQMGTWEVDLATGTGHWSQLTMEIYGVDRSMLTRQERLERVHPDDRVAFKTANIAARAGGQFAHDYRIVRTDGEVRWVSSYGVVHRDEAGAPIRAVGVVQDITDRKLAEESIRRLNSELEARIEQAVGEREVALAQLHEAQKLETLGQLTGGVAHDFNNLLTPIVGSLDMLRRRLPGDPRADRLIDGALQAADRARTLVSRLLAFGRRQVLQPRPVDVAALLSGMTDLIQRSIGQHINVVVRPEEALPPARVDPNQLELAILNLSINSRDAMPGGGTLTISAHAEKLPRPNDLRLTAGRYVRLSVIDTGMGMDEDTLKRAVEPFFTTKGVGKGTGLGLSMIHGLAGQLGGTLKLSSTVGIGTHVDLWLPVAETEAAPPAVQEAAPARPQAKAATLLLVDDEELVRMSAADMLSELGYAVVEAGSGAEALRIVEAGEPIDALVTDYLMPGMNGGELVEAARKLCPGLPAMIVTGYASVEGLNLRLPLLSKPFRQDELAARVAALLEAQEGAAVSSLAETAG